MIDSIKNRVKNCDEVSILSFVCIVGIIGSIVSTIIECFDGYYSYSSIAINIIFLAPLITLFVYIRLHYKNNNVKLYEISIILKSVIVLIITICDIEYMGFMSIILILGLLVLSVFVLIFIHKKADKKSHIIIVSILYSLCLIIGFQTFEAIIFSAIITYVNSKIIKVKKSKAELIEEILIELKNGYDKGLISEEFYNNKKKEILNKF